MKPTKEELVELIGMADLLEAKLEKFEMHWYSIDAANIARSLRCKLDEICGEEYLESQRNYGNN